jgi:mono/diheme cytochrome c family protein
LLLAATLGVTACTPAAPAPTILPAPTSPASTGVPIATAARSTPSPAPVHVAVPVASPGVAVARPAASPAAALTTPAASPVAAASPGPRLLPTPGAAPKPSATGILGLGRPATAQDTVAFAIPADGKGLPAGSGTAAEGAPLYSARCAICHGVQGQGTPNGPLLVAPVPWHVGGPISMGNFAPYAPPIFGFIWGSQPYDQPQTLSPSEAYALTAWILAQHKIVGPTERMDAQTLPQVHMPNRDAFRPGDPRPDVP